MACPINKIDSNVTGLAFAEEECLKVLPTTPTWYAMEPNSYTDFGAEITTMARSPIDPSRQNKKGNIVDLDASGGFNNDFTQTNMTRLLQGFFFADAREMPTTAPLTGSRTLLTGAAASGSEYSAASGLNVFAEGQLIKVTGFNVNANNGFKRVLSASSAALGVSGALVNETPPANAKIEVVGFQFEEGTANLSEVGGRAVLSVTGTDLTTLPGLFPGKWVFIGGDETASRFVNSVGYARIDVIESGSLTFDDTTFSPTSEAGTGKSIQIFTGTALRNEKVPSLIKRRSYNIERTLGMGAVDPQAEYLEGAIANELTLNIPQADKINADLAFVALDNTFRSGDANDKMKTGTRVSAPGEDAFNTSSNLYRLKMNIHDSNNSNPSALFGYVSEASLTIANGVAPNKALAVVGAFDTSAGNFVVGGSLTAYFTTVAAVKAVRANADVGMSLIAAVNNAGFLFDIPLLGLGGGRLNVEKDNPITVPLEPMAGENKHGYTLLHQTFNYLPSVAMPT